MNPTTVTFNKQSFLLKTYGITFAVIGLYQILNIALSVPINKILPQVGFAVLLSIGFWAALRTSRLLFASHYYVTCSYLFLFFNGITSAGISNPGVIWFLLCPLVSFLTLNSIMTRFWLFMVVLTLCAFYFLEDYLIIDKFQRGKEWNLIASLFQFATIYYMVKIFRKDVNRKTRELEALNKLLTDAESSAVNRNSRLDHYLNQLLDVRRMEELHTGSLDYSILTVQRILLKAMNLDSVGIWHLDEKGENLILIGSLDSTNDTFLEPALLSKQSFLETFEMLESGVIILSPNENQRTPPLEFPFTDQLQNLSTIGCPYFIEGKFAGFFSCRAHDRKWSAEDVLFVRAISDTLPLAFKSHMRKKQQLLLEVKQHEITKLNESLEQMVSDRTAELKVRNEQLLKFAFINAHNIRGPICRLLGLRNLLDLAKSPEEILMLRDYFSASIEELDTITRKASRLLEDVTPPGELKLE